MSMSHGVGRSHGGVEGRGHRIKTKPLRRTSPIAEGFAADDIGAMKVGTRVYFLPIFGHRTEYDLRQLVVTVEPAPTDLRRRSADRNYPFTSQTGASSPEFEAAT